MNKGLKLYNRPEWDLDILNNYDMASNDENKFLYKLALPKKERRTEDV